MNTRRLMIACAIALLIITLYLAPFASILICQHESRFGFCSEMFVPVMSLGGWFTAYLYGVAVIEIAVLATPFSYVAWKLRR